MLWNANNLVNMFYDFQNEGEIDITLWQKELL
jgi:hypothetical protein